MRRDTLIDFFEDLAGARGGFLVHDDGFRSRSFSYQEVGNASRAFAARLQKAGLGKSDHAVFYSENRPEWIAAFWGCLLAGVVVVPIDYRASPAFLARVAGIVSAQLILTGEDAAEPEETTVPIWPLQSVEWPEHADLPLPAAIVSDDVAEIIFTSGATADPKGVVITHRNVLANIVPIEREILRYKRWLRLISPVRLLNLLPLSHMFGQAMTTFIPPMLPGVVVFMRGHNPGEVIEQIKKRRISVLVSVPKILDVLRDHTERRLLTTGRLHSLFGWKFWAFVVGAAPLDSALEAFWRERRFAVIQGYGLTEAAPIVTINHPFAGRPGSVGKAIPGVDLRIAPDGEILLRGENITRGYFNADREGPRPLEDGWFHTGDIGEIGADGQLFVLGRKKEMIVTPEGLNVFPEDVEQVLNRMPGVRESAVVGTAAPSGERVLAVLVAAPGLDPDAVAREANLQLADHQKIRRAVLWPESSLPRTEGTQKLKRAAIRDWLNKGAEPRPAAHDSDVLGNLVAKYAGRAALPQETTIDELGLSSLERVELMVAIEDRFDTRLDEAAFAEARDLSALGDLVERGAAPAPAGDFPVWNQSWPARALRRISLPTWILPIARLFARITVEGRERLDHIDRPMIFAANHQSHLDTPVILAALPARFRYRVAPAMAKEFFAPHFFPDQAGRTEWLTSSLNYYLAALLFNAFPIPQREIGTRQTLRYIGELIDRGISILIFPEGSRTERGDIHPFKPGVGMIASRLRVPVVPVRLEGVDRVLHRSWRMAKPGRVRVAFGEPLQLNGGDYASLAQQVETMVRNL